MMMTTLSGTCTATLSSDGKKWSFRYSGDCWNDAEDGYDFSGQSGAVGFTLSLSDSTGRLSFTSDGMDLVKHKDKGDKDKWKQLKDYGAPFSGASVSASAVTFTDANNDGEKYNFCCEFSDSGDSGKTVKDDPVIINKGGNA